MSNQDSYDIASAARKVEKSSDGEAAAGGKQQPSEGAERERWERKADFMLSCIGFAVGLGNVWRFPYLCYDNGGGAFLVPYLIMLIVCGMPLFYVELAAGQYFSLGPVGTWGAISPMFKGIGFGMMMVSFLIGVYYNVIISWCLYFLGLSFREHVLWKDCGNWWNTEYCYAGRRPNNNTCKNASAICTNQTVSPTKEFWENYVLRPSDGVDNPGSLRWQLVLCLFAAWVLVYFCMWKGIKSSGKVVYFTATFPYVVLLILFVRGVTLPNASDGIVYYLKPDWNRLKDAKVWVAAATQIFFSLGNGMGSLIVMGSYNKFHNNIPRDAMIISLINCGTSFFSGFVIFSTLGFMAAELNRPIEEVAQSGMGLAFVVYPEAIAQMPISPLWAVLFFFMLLTLGLDSQFALLEAVITGLSDIYPNFVRKYKERVVAVVCLFCFLVGLSCVSQGGLYVLNLMDSQAGGLSLFFLVFFEAATLGWVYGTGRFSQDVEKMVGYKPCLWWRICWVCVPFLMAGLFIFFCYQWSGLSLGEYKYPIWAEVIGWLIALSSMLFVPGVAIYQLLWNSSGPILERVSSLLKPDADVARQIEERENLGRVELGQYNRALEAGAV